MNILMLNYEYPPLGGGASNATYYLLKEFSQIDDNITIDLITSSATNDFEEEKLNDSIHLYKLPVGKKSLHYWTHREIIVRMGILSY